MTLEVLGTHEHVIGIKQVKKALVAGRTSHIFLAEDAETHILAPLEELAREHGVEVIRVASMQALGRACSIDVGAAAAAVVEPAAR